MVFSNEEMLRRKHIDDSINPDGMSIQSILNWEKRVTVVDVNKRFNDYFAESYYNAKSFAEAYGADFKVLDRELKSQFNIVMLSNEKSRQELEKCFAKVVEQKGEKVYKGENVIDNIFCGQSPQLAIALSKLYMLFNEDRDLSCRFFKNNRPQVLLQELKRLSESEGTLPFAVLKKEQLAQTEELEKKLQLMVNYLYEENGYFEGRVEKEAADYYMQQSNFLHCFADNVTEKEIDKTRKQTYKWLKERHKPKSFLELNRAEGTQDKLQLICQLVQTFGFSLYNCAENRLEQRQVQELMAVLDKHAAVYNGDKEVRDLLVYFCFAVSNILRQLYSYSDSYIHEVFAGEKRNLAYEQRIKSLEKENEPLRALAKSRQEQLNSMQLELDRMKNKELAKLKEELERQKELQKELEERIASLTEMNEVLETQIDVQEDAAEAELTADVKPNSYVEKKLRELNVIVMGGHQIWQNRLKEIYPYFTYLDSENVNYDINITRNADIVFFNTLHCSHTLFYRVKGNVNKGRQNNKEKIIFIGSNNLENFKEIVSQAVLKY